MKKTVALVLVVALSFAMMLTACAPKDATVQESAQPAEQATAAPAATAAQPEPTAAAEPLKIVLMPKLIGIPYFNASEAGCKKAGEELGVNAIYAGPTKPDAAEQVKMIEDFISQGVDAICVAPNDPAALTPVLKKAKEAGIVIIDWDTPADQSVVDYSLHQIDDKQYGEHIWDLLVKAMGTDTGEYAIITGALEAANLNLWINNGLEYAKAKYPNLKLVTEKVPSDEQQQLAYQKALELIKTYPDLKGIIGISSPAPIGAAQAIQEKGLQGKVSVVGSALPASSGPFLEDGSLDTATAWDPGMLGYLAIFVAKTKIEGGTITDQMEVPGIGKITLKEDGKTIIMGPPTDFVKDNYKNYNF